uniref:Bloodthirsty-related gene family, member 1 n=1 Tax=Gasterosteus aculeatus aculeatus TaxID=481459 RepID=A0AAQ4PZX9_GASAC
MSLDASFLSDEQFLCSICLDVFTNPSSTPCGHSFCMACISRYWDGSKVCQCPLCKTTYHKRPDLQINRTLREITDQFKFMSGGAVKKRGAKRGGGGKEGGTRANFLDELRKKLPRAVHQPSAPIPCGTPREPMPTVTATTSLASSVPDQGSVAAGSGPSALPPSPPHCQTGGRRRFTVSGAASASRLPVCEIHHRGIMIYCRTDRLCVCPECETLDHEDHDTVPLKDEWMETKEKLSVSEQEVQEMIRWRTGKIEEVKRSATEMEAAAERELAGGVGLFSQLASAMQHSQAELAEVTDISRRAAALQADAMVRQLELEVEELRCRESTLAELAQSDDHLHCVKTFPTLSGRPPAKDWSRVSVNSDLGTGSIYRSLAALLERFQEDLLTIAETGFPASPRAPSPLRSEPRMRRVQEYAVDVTLDVNTAHPKLILSEDMKSVRRLSSRVETFFVFSTSGKRGIDQLPVPLQVRCGDRHQMLPDNPERFDRVVCVIGREAISSGRHYWEVDVGGKTDWDLGVARQSMNRKGKINVTPSNGYWFLSLRDKKKYAFRSEPSADVPLTQRPHRIGIFVDFENGQVSFYNVDAKTHIYTFNDTFSECIHPFFSPCTNKSRKNEGPLTITPVT